MTLSLCMKCTVGMPVAAVSGLLGQDYAQGTGQDMMSDGKRHPALWPILPVLRMAKNSTV